MKTLLEMNTKPLASLLSFFFVIIVITFLDSGCTQSSDDPTPAPSSPNTGKGTKPEEPSSEPVPTYLSNIAIDTAFSYNPENVVVDSVRALGGILENDYFMKIRYVQSNRPIRPNTKQIIGYIEFDDIEGGHSFDLYRSYADASFDMQSGVPVSHFFDLDSLKITDWLVGQGIDKGDGYKFIVLNSYTIKKNSVFPVYLTTKNFKGSAKGSFNFKMLFEVKKAGSAVNSTWFNHVYGEQQEVALLEFKE